ncbi:MAG: polymerase sigma-70 factor, subfamily [Acidimicrobiaceae bacterium]|jgi:RNA polymerase sigma-70 factor (ECF subfamily)
MKTDWSQSSDAALVVAIGRWREDALAEAYRRHGGAVYALARRVVRDTGIAEEVVQEVFVRLWSSPDRFDPERGSLRSWLLAQGHGRSIDRLRSDASRRLREERDAQRTADAGYDVEREAWDLAVADRVNVVMADLPFGERKAIELAYFDGYTYREVAKLLDTPEGTIKSRIRAGLKRMRADLIDAETGQPWHRS